MVDGSSPTVPVFAIPKVSQLFPVPGQGAFGSSISAGKMRANCVTGQNQDHAIGIQRNLIEEAAQEAFDTPRIVELVHNAPQAVWPFADLSQRKHKLRGRA
jgi:hypothetical protein